MDDQPIQHANPLDTPTNHTSLIKVIVWILTIVSCACVFVRSGIKWATVKQLDWDDLFIVLALLFCFASGICATIATTHGYGDLDRIFDDQTSIVEEKLVLAYNLSYFFSHGFSMLSIISLIRNISPAKLHRRIASGIGIGIIVWTVVAVFGFTFQCSPVASFATGTCANRPALYTSIALFNLILEVALILQPVLLTGTLNMAISKKITIIICFLGRLVVIAALIAQIVVIWDRDTTKNILMDFGFITTTLLIPNLSVMAACTPYLRPFFLSLQAKSWNLDFGYPMSSSQVKSSRISRTRSGIPSAQDLGSNKDWKFERLPTASAVAGRLRPDKLFKGTTTITTNSLHEDEQNPTKIEAGAIERTVDFSVEVEHVGVAK